MSFNIKKNILSLLSKKDILEKGKYTYSFKIRTHLLIFLTTITYFFIPNIFGLDFYESRFIEGFYESIFMMGLLFGILTMIFYIVSFLKTGRKNIFKFQRDRLNIEKKLDSQFGSVDKVIEIYNEIYNLNLILTDENFYKILNEPLEERQKRAKVKDVRTAKIKKIDERIEKLMEERNNVNLRMNQKEEKILNGIKEIEYKGVDMSMDLSELKERVVAGGLS